MAKIFVAEKQGKCPACGKEMQGTRIVKDNKDDKYKHADCVFPPRSASSDITGNGKVPPSAQAGAKITLMIDKAMEEAIDERSRRRLRRAKAVVDSEFSNADYSLYAPLLGAVYASLYGEEASIRIEKSRERR